jgi:hypothetical protein
MTPAKRRRHLQNSAILVALLAVAQRTACGGGDAARTRTANSAEESTPAEGQAANDGFDQGLSTAKSKSGILVDVHSVCPRKLDCSSQSASPVPIEWTTS